MSLPDFLRARIAEEKARALSARDKDQCAAKSGIVDLYWTWPVDDYAEGRASMHDDVLSLLALPYADHPDYRESWRP